MISPILGPQKVNIRTLKELHDCVTIIINNAKEYNCGQQALKYWPTG